MRGPTSRAVRLGCGTSRFRGCGRPVVVLRPGRGGGWAADRKARSTRRVFPGVRGAYRGRGDEVRATTVNELVDQLVNNPPHQRLFPASESSLAERNRDEG